MHPAARKFLKTLAIILLCLVLVPVATGATVLATLIYRPSPVNLPPVNSSVESQISHLYDINGKEIGIFKLFEENIPVKKTDIPDVLKNAVIATEDRNFYNNNGIDLRGIVRAAFADVASKEIVQGGSTITQQYVRNAYLGREQTITRKLREIVLASQVARKLPKDDIMHRYLSSTYFGSGAYGVGAAANTYFRKPVNDLTLSEAATLTGIIPAPSVYDPRIDPKGAEKRRIRVLRKMKDAGVISQDEYKTAYFEKIRLESQGPAKKKVVTIYPPLRQQPKYPYFYDYVRQYLVQKYGVDRVFRGGLDIQTTLDPALQAHGEQVIKDGLGNVDPDIDMAMASVEPQTGFVRTLVGGRGISQTNLALAGCPNQSQFESISEVKAACWSQEFPQSGGTGRQPGSAFKPFVLATAYSQGIRPTDRFSGANYTVPGCTDPRGRCTIRNSESASYGMIDLKSATTKSVNGVYARLIHQTGFNPVAKTAKKMGLNSVFFSKQHWTESGTFALGVSETGPLDMASAYGVFANRGLRLPPTPVVKVVDSKGRVLEDNTDRKAARVLKTNVADNVTDALKGVVTSGTAAARGNIGRPAAGKTGTNSNFSDAWFVGYTPTLSTAVWLGHRTNRDPVVVPPYGTVFGGELPTATWASFMRFALKDVEITDFKEPAPIEAPANLSDILAGRNRKARDLLGILPGAAKTPFDDTGGEYEIGPGDAQVDAPPLTVPKSTTTSSTSSTIP